MTPPVVEEPDGFTIGEVAARAGVTTRTIHYYVAQGLLPGPGKQGPRTRYSQTFLDLLLRARRLQVERNISLRGIRRVFESEGLVEPVPRRRSRRRGASTGDWPTQDPSDRAPGGPTGGAPISPSYTDSRARPEAAPGAIPPARPEAVQGATPPSRPDVPSSLPPDSAPIPSGPTASDLLAGLKALVGERSIPSSGSGDRWVTVPVSQDLILAGRRLGRDELQALQRAADYLRTILLAAGS